MAVEPRSGGTLTYDPGADAARRYPDWVIRHRPLHGLHEVLCPVRKVILLENEHDRASRRCSLAHAVAHIDLDHQATSGGILGVRQEASADRLASRRLIEVRTLVDALGWSTSLTELASELDVDAHMLDVRLAHLHPAERSLIRRVAGSAVLTA